jgi:hypothetical protein
LDKLFNSTARWLYNDTFSDSPYFFDNFWSDYHNGVSAEYKSNESNRKRKPVSQRQNVASTPTVGQNDPTNTMEQNAPHLYPNALSDYSVHAKKVLPHVVQMMDLQRQ